MMKGQLASRNWKRQQGANPVGFEYMIARAGGGAVPVYGGGTAAESGAIGSGVHVTDIAQLKNNLIKGNSYPVTVTNNAYQLRPEEPDRRFFFLENHDPLGNVTVSWGSRLPFGVGMRAGAGGGGIVLDINVPTASIWVVGDIANNPNVSITVF